MHNIFLCMHIFHIFTIISNCWYMGKDLPFSRLMSAMSVAILHDVWQVLELICRCFLLGDYKRIENHINPFPHIDAFWRLYCRRLFENIVTKEEIAQNVQFLLWPQCFPLFVTGYPFNYWDFLCFDKIRSKSSAAELSYEGKG